MQLKKIKTQSVKKTKVKTLTPPFHWTHKWHVMSVKRNMQLIAAIKVNGLFPTRANLTRLRSVSEGLGRGSLLNLHSDSILYMSFF